MKRQMLTMLFALVAVTALLTIGAAPVAAQGGYGTHLVQPGERLAKIARAYCTTWQEIYRINRDTIGPNPNAVEPGMVLTVPYSCPPLPTQPPSGVYDRGPSTHAAGTFRSPYYTAVWGDTLFSIGRRFGVSTTAIRQANGMQSDRVWTGMTLLIPGASGSEWLPTPPVPEIPVPELERVYFGYGGISATRTGIIAGGVAKGYILGGQAGRVMEIGTVSHGEPLSVSVTAVGGTQLALNGENDKIGNNLWVRLPTTGDYIVRVAPVSTPENPNVAFRITFIIQ